MTNLCIKRESAEIHLFWGAHGHFEVLQGRLSRFESHWQECMIAHFDDRTSPELRNVTNMTDISVKKILAG